MNNLQEIDDKQKLEVALQWLREARTYINITNDSKWSFLLLASLDYFLLNIEEVQ